jgi:hypothetical protein
LAGCQPRVGRHPVRGRPRLGGGVRAVAGRASLPSGPRPGPSPAFPFRVGRPAETMGDGGPGIRGRGVPGRRRRPHSPIRRQPSICQASRFTSGRRFPPACGSSADLRRSSRGASVRTSERAARRGRARTRRARGWKAPLQARR